ncbi:radical SAM protein [Proteiniborus sp. MB09-C3]|uniref:radical SAM protein n=1 Tax=Proteiniborus sp. MB09-C3 TaxID=3050072 RepID=UPI002554205F|nr:radical SAM protein [Proteiniborus sp. MB09-C3]WIV13366.1 radical SAM protein [Proteiniborus sp. MB09-C3]
MLSQYVEIIPINDEYVLFNKANGTLILLSSSDMKIISDNEVSSLNCDLYLNLKECDMLNDTEIVLNTETDFFSIGIEMSTICNLKCKYCYQSNERSRTEIERDTIEKILIYAKKVLELHPNFKEISLSFIGGEPLIHKTKLSYIYDRFKYLAEDKGIVLSVHIDTNGTIPFSDIFTTMDNLNVSISLTNKEDHNLNRGEFDTIVRNLLSILPKKTNSINIRYNVNHKNMYEFSSFLSSLRKKLPICTTVEAMNTDNYEYNKGFRNQLTNDEYIKWKSTKAIEAMIKCNYPIAFSLSSGLKLCYAYQPYSCKVFSDGAVTLCDSMFHDKSKTNIDVIANNPQKLNEIYSEYKNYDPLLEDDCKNCKDIVLCGGHILCRNTCEFQTKYDIDLFIKSYVKAFKSGKSDCFVNM